MRNRGQAFWRHVDIAVNLVIIAALIVAAIWCVWYLATGQPR